MVWYLDLFQIGSGVYTCAATVGRFLETKRDLNSTRRSLVSQRDLTQEDLYVDSLEPEVCDEEGDFERFLRSIREF